MKTSSKHNVNVNELFEQVAEKVLHVQQKHDGSIIPVRLASTSVDLHENYASPISSPNGGISHHRQSSQAASPSISNHHDRRNSDRFNNTLDEKKDDGLNGMQEPNESGDLGLASKCDASKFICVDANEMMRGDNGQYCMIQ